MGAVDRNRKSCKPVEEAEFENKVAHKPRERFVDDFQDTRANTVVKHGDCTDGTEAVYLFKMIGNRIIGIVLQIAMEMQHLRAKI